MANYDQPVSDDLLRALRVDWEMQSEEGRKNIHEIADLLDQAPQSSRDAILTKLYNGGESRDQHLKDVRDYLKAPPPPAPELLSALRVENWYDLEPEAQKSAITLAEQLDGMDQTSRDQAMTQIQGNIHFLNTRRVFTGNRGNVDAKDIDSLIGGLKDALQPAPQTPVQQAQAQVQTAQDQSGVHPVGLGYTPISTSSEWDQLSKMLGYNAQQAYQDYKNNYQKAAAMLQPISQASRGFVGGINQALGSLVPNIKALSDTDWLRQQQSHLQGLAAPLFAGIDAAYMQATGTHMDLTLQKKMMDQLDQIKKDAPELYTQILAGIPTMQTAVDTYNANPKSPTAYGGLLTALSRSGFSYQGAAAPLLSTFDDYLKTQAAVKGLDDKITQKNISAFASATGKAPSAQQIKEMSGMDETSLTMYLDKLPSPIANVPLGEYNTAYGNMLPLWRENFGRTPTLDEVRGSVGMTKEELQNHVDNSNSKVSGVNVGQYKNYQKWGDATSQEIFGRNLDDHLIGLLHKEMA